MKLDRHNVAVVIPALNESLRIREVVEGEVPCPIKWKPEPEVGVEV